MLPFMFRLYVSGKMSSFPWCFCVLGRGAALMLDQRVGTLLVCNQFLYVDELFVRRIVFSLISSVFLLVAMLYVLLVS